jgi:hypothetical protein
MHKPCPGCRAPVNVGLFIGPTVCKGCGAGLKPRLIPGRSVWPVVFWIVLAAIGLAGMLFLDIRYKRPSGTIRLLLMLGCFGSLFLSHYQRTRSSEFVLAEDARERK